MVAKNRVLFVGTSFAMFIRKSTSKYKFTNLHYKHQYRNKHKLDILLAMILIYFISSMHRPSYKHSGGFDHNDLRMHQIVEYVCVYIMEVVKGCNY